MKLTEAEVAVGQLKVIRLFRNIQLFIVHARLNKMGLPYHLKYQLRCIFNLNGSIFIQNN